MHPYPRSEALFHEAQTVLAGGVSSSIRAAMKPLPLFASRAYGAYLEDVDGHRYIDYLLAYGPTLLGHAHPQITARITEALGRGYTYGLQHSGEIELARKLIEILPCADLVAYSDSGTEAVMLALRLARAHTGRVKILRFEGHYHGWADSIFTAFPSPDMRGQQSNGDGVQPGTGGQSQHALEDVLLLPWNDFEALEAAFEQYGPELAAVISEPVMCNSGCILPLPGYLERLRELSTRHGVVLILDEVITGFRVALGGAQERLGITPDLVTLGKALANGVAMSAVAGKAEIMGHIASGRVNHLGTLNGNTVAVEAALATLELLTEDGGTVYNRLEVLSDQLVGGLRSLLELHHLSGVVNACGAVFHLMFTTQKEVKDFAGFQSRDAARYSRFAQGMLEQGVLLRQTGLWYISAAHSRQDIEQTLEAANRVLEKLT
jgi:glutamate-1-semialdehyde 2,1-aminomutase